MLKKCNLYVEGSFSQDKISLDDFYAENITLKDFKLFSLDLFSGCGGLTLGFKKAGVTSIFASDIDPNCQLTFNYNFPNVPFFLQDITSISKAEVDKFLQGKTPDIIIGGPPCQGFSLANKNRNNLNTDPRNKLFYQFLKFINWYNPKVFVMENVKGLLSMKNGEVIDTIYNEFTKAGQGYVVRVKVLKASDYGVPQCRERVVIIGYRNDIGKEPLYPHPIEGEITVDMAINDLPKINAGEGVDVQNYVYEAKNSFQRLMRVNSKFVYNHIAMKHTKRLVDRFHAIKTGQNLLDVWETHGAVKRGSPQEKSDIKFSQNNFRVYGNKPAPTVAASFQSNFIHPYLDRNFTAREGARLQSFPDDFVFQGFRTKMSWEVGLSQYQQIGNAVPPLLAFAIARQIVKDLI
ncbi:MAG: DNA cytosine methyltransferase [Phascolarctobacterium sp.]|nr:DNA cytosine methyltransferase [Candidatus Phascolarctobacterium caballi]